MKLAVMQPYFYPYVGYFELIRDVDVFVFLNDVQYIRRGWVNRNRIRNKDKGWIYLTVPVKSHARDTLLKDVEAADGDWHDKHCETLRTTYRGASSHPLYKEYESAKPTNLCDFLCSSIESTSRLLGLPTLFVRSESLRCEGKGQDRIVNICKAVGCDEYRNLSGGRELYDEDVFSSNGIRLRFQEPVRHGNLLSVLDLMLGDHLSRLAD